MNSRLFYLECEGFLAKWPPKSKSFKLFCDSLFKLFKIICCSGKFLIRVWSSDIYKLKQSGEKRFFEDRLRFETPVLASESDTWRLGPPAIILGLSVAIEDLLPCSFTYFFRASSITFWLWTWSSLAQIAVSSKFFSFIAFEFYIEF